MLNLPQFLPLNFNKLFIQVLIFGIFKYRYFKIIYIFKFFNLQYEMALLVWKTEVCIFTGHSSNTKILKKLKIYYPSIYFKIPKIRFWKLHYRRKKGCDFEWWITRLYISVHIIIRNHIIASLLFLLLLLYNIIVMYDTFIIGAIGVVCCMCSQTANQRVRTAGRDTRSGAARPGTKCPTNTTRHCSTLPVPAVTTVTQIWWTIGTRRTSGCAKARRSAGEAVVAAAGLPKTV